ncbi:MAG: hypothetical protein AAGI28_05450 [Pseudomonadota bacterium]
MIVWSTIVATVISTVAIWLASQRNPKRRRSAGLKKIATAPLVKWGLLLVSITPGVALVALGNTSGFICWFAAITVIGWLVAVKRPSAA